VKTKLDETLEFSGEKVVFLCFLIN
jgi:hypothetical protein